LIEFSLACWQAGATAFDRLVLVELAMTENLRRNVAATTAKIESVKFDQPLDERLLQIDARHPPLRISLHRRSHPAALHQGVEPFGAL
jgi:hypothetical protein